MLSVAAKIPPSFLLATTTPHLNVIQLFFGAVSEAVPFQEDEVLAP